MILIPDLHGGPGYLLTLPSSSCGRYNFVMRYLSGFVITMLCAQPVLADGDAAKGRALAEQHCARCHVVGDFNKFGGIGSTPSFQGIAGMKDGIERFQTFYERRPHPAFVTVPDVPKWSKAPPYAVPFRVTPESIEDVVSFVKTLKPKNLDNVPVIGGVRKRRRLGQ